MIKAAFIKKENGTLLLAVNGHAGMAVKGKDIICSAASILAFTLAQTLKYTEAEGWLERPLYLKLNAGDALIEAKPKNEFRNEILHTFFMAEVGYSLLAQNYPNYLKLKVFGEA